ncbi:MAG: acetyl-CoA carboxylase carboxyltransferase subunit alpha [Alphaproteobacteria bacterium]|jgi:acetyl-CoA carboxylase carboxyl transferase subunit alpha|nr:acetyl-CoA carboxylase carboxyltransferase subunit alpha [Alphaproteobacteria bacterium]
MNYLDFENEIALLENKLKDLSETNGTLVGTNFSKEIESLDEKYKKLLETTYKNLTPWQKVAVARHQDRPHALDYIHNIITNFVPLSGDRLFAEDAPIVAGIGRLKNQSVMVIGIEKGNDLESRIKHNFGMPKPEGYRKAQRLMKLADKLDIPIITLVDTSGAYPGQEAEERGQGEAIAKSIATCLEITTPLINIIIGEGGSGGAIAVASGDVVMMLEHSVYSVISPEGCASILWRNDNMAKEAADMLHLTAKDLLKLKIIDKIIHEPIGGAHRNRDATYKAVSEAILDSLKKLKNLPADQRKAKKRQKFIAIGKAI